MSSSDKKFTRGPWYGAKKYDNEELLAIARYWDEKRANEENKEVDPDEETVYEGPLHADTENEKKSNEAMMANGVRYLKLILTDLNGDPRPLAGRSAIGKTTSRVLKLISLDDTTKEPKTPFPTRNIFQTRMLITDFSDRDAVEAQIREIVEALVEEKCPDMNAEEKAKVVEQQIPFKRKEVENWEVFKWYSEEWLQYMRSDNILDKFNLHSYKENFKPCIQSKRKWDQNIPEDKKNKKAKKSGFVALDEWIIRRRVGGNGHTGELWAKIYDMNKGSKATGKSKKKYQQVKVKNANTGKLEHLNTDNFSDYMTYGSAFFDDWDFQMCIHSKGASMPLNCKNLYVKRAAPMESSEEVEAPLEYEDQFDNMFGNFETLEETQAKQKANKDTTTTDGDDDEDSDEDDDAHLYAAQNQLNNLIVGDTTEVDF
ncbi:MAG: hypothetical protein P1U70_25390 [Saprospiraceae bacterium]|nr:hypothetical protein [Saprospiraceae bacterium]